MKEVDDAAWDEALLGAILSLDCESFARPGLAIGKYSRVIAINHTIN